MQTHTDFAIFTFRNLARTITNKNKHKNNQILCDKVAKSHANLSQKQAKSRKIYKTFCAIMRDLWLQMLLLL